MPESVKLDVSVEKVSKSIDLILRIAESMTKIIPGDVDDRILLVFRQFADQPWFSELVVTLLNMFDTGKPISKEQATNLAGLAIVKHMTKVAFPERLNDAK